MICWVAIIRDPIYICEVIIINENNEIRLVIDNDVLERYSKYYFMQHPRAKKVPIKSPYHDSINAWMILQRSAMNRLKQKWKDFIKWFVDEQGYSNLRIEKCEISQYIHYGTDRRHDVDNGVPKFIIDGLVESGMVVDDDFEHINKLVLECDIDLEHPRTELSIKMYEISYTDSPSDYNITADEIADVVL